jgi:membrane-associated phospholipid phosphatase
MLMTHRKKHFLWTYELLGCTLWIGLLFLASLYDLRLSQAVANPHSLYGRIVSTFGEWPAWGVILGAMGLLGCSRSPDSHLRPYRPLAWSLILMALLCPGLITQSLKLLWGRVRFVHLDRSLSNYRPFYSPLGLGGGDSFPSGHVAMAFVPTPIPLYYAIYQRKGLVMALVSALVLIVYGLGVAWGRICYGRHYLTDTIFSMACSLQLAPLLLHRLMAAHSSKNVAYDSESRVSSLGK